MEDGNLTLAKILEGLLRFRRVDTDDAHSYVNMSDELNNIVGNFARIIIESYANSPNSTKVGFTPKEETGKKNRDRRYAAIVLHDLKCGKQLPATNPVRCGLSIKPTDIHHNIEVVSSFLEGTMIYNEQSNELQIPSRPSRTQNELPDLSSWSEEIGFFEADRSLIYFEPRTILESYNHVANYEAYWRAIVRGIEHQLSIRTYLQKMETRTTELTEQIPKLLRLCVPKDDASANEVGTEVRCKLDDLAADLSDVVSMLPKLRQISTTATAFRSGKAISKFDRLGHECFQFPKMLKNIQQNVDELGDFLQYATAQELRGNLIELEKEIKEQSSKQHDEAKALSEKSKELTESLLKLNTKIDDEAKEVKRRDDQLVRIGLLIAASSIIFASFSFIIDANSFFTIFNVGLANPTNRQDGFLNSTGTKAVVIYFLILCLMSFLIIRQTPVYLDWQLKRAEVANKKPAKTEKGFLGKHLGIIIFILALLILLFTILWG
jgi:predicted  nucleic acid-binding Zn-ribbon protein